MAYRTGKGRGWWRDRFVTLMLIPERTRRVHRVVLPFFFLKLCLILVAVVAILLVAVGVDYVQVLGKVAENKRLKGENYKLQQEIQLIRNKVELMENSIDRVRNYAKKLQILTGQGTKKTKAKKSGDKQSKLDLNSLNEMQLGGTNSVVRNVASVDLTKRVDGLEQVSFSTELFLSELEDFLLTRRSIANATPSVFPLQGTISSRYGYRRHPKDGKYRMHYGIDLYAEPGTPVRAPANGVVIYSGYKSGYGKVVVIDHGYDIHTLFAHNSRFFVNEGDRVRRGQTISQVGSTGRSTGPHLHFEIRKNGRPINPLDVLTGY